MLQSSRNNGQFRMPGDLSKSLNTIDTIPEETAEQGCGCGSQEDPFETGDNRRRTRSEALTQEPQELLSVPGSRKAQSLKRSPPPVSPSATLSAALGEESCISIVTLDQDTYSNLLENDFEMNGSYEVLDAFDMEEEEGDRSIYFGESEMMCSSNQAAGASENGTSGVDGVDGGEQNTVSVKFPVSSSAQLQVFYTRLEHIILNVPDFPPARTFVE